MGTKPALGTRGEPAAKTFAEREAAVLAREQTVLSRQKAVGLREEAAGARAGFSEYSEAQFREVNERLVVATVDSEMKAEVAEQATARMSYVAEHDFLTGLTNRAVMAARLEQSLALARRHGKKAAVIYVDLDHFKDINDSLGHAVGDHVLQSAAKRLQACVRNSDTVSRHGGDEFVVLLAEVERAQDAVLTADKLVAAMAAPYITGGHRLHVTLSMGISVYPEDGRDVDALLMNADTAMYHAKRNGRNNYQRFTPDMNARAVVR